MTTEIKAGRKLDAIVAERLFGWRWEKRFETSDPSFIPPENDPRLVWCAEWDDDGYPDYLPHYSSDSETVSDVLNAITRPPSGLAVKITGGDEGLEIPYCVQIGSARHDIVLSEAHSMSLPLAVSIAVEGLKK